MSPVPSLAFRDHDDHEIQRSLTARPGYMPRSGISQASFLFFSFLFSSKKGSRPILATPFVRGALVFKLTNEYACNSHLPGREGHRKQPLRPSMAWFASVRGDAGQPKKTRKKSREWQHTSSHYVPSLALFSFSLFSSPNRNVQIKNSICS